MGTETVPPSEVEVVSMEGREKLETTVFILRSDPSMSSNVPASAKERAK